MQIIICDHGDGFKKVLGSTYEEDISIPINERENPTELKIIDYAFEKMSTSKKEKLLSEIAKNEDYERLKPPKGLYFVKELLKKKKGFLSVRSGSSILCYDFLSNNKVKVSTSQDDTSLKLANFRGVQYKLFIPIKLHEIISGEPEGLQSALVDHKIPKTYSFHYIPVKNYLLDHTQLDLNRIFTDIKRVSTELKDKGITVLDFSNTDLKKQYLYPLIKKIMFLQEEEKLIIGFNLCESKGVTEIISDCIIEDKMREKMFIWIDDKLNKNFIGVEDECRNLYLDYQKKIEKGEDVRIDNRLEKLLKHSEHLLWYDQQEQRYYEKLQMSDFLKNLVAYKIRTIRERILDENNKVFYPGKFLIPSVTYAEGFFEINRLYSEFEDREKLINTLAYLYILKHIDFSTIVTASDIAGKIAEDLINKIKNLREDQYEELKHFKLTYEKPIIGYEFTILNENEKILLLTDVVGTAKSIGRHIEKIFVSNTKLKLENISTFTIVDAREGEEKTIEEEVNFEGIHRDKFYFEPKNPEIKQAGICELCSFLKWPIKYHNEKPPDWDYKDIIVIDPKAHSPIEKRQELLEKVKDWREFLEKYCVDAVIVKHLIFDDGAHYNYFFATNIIADRYKHCIAIIVKEDVQDLKKRVKGGKSILPNIKVLYSKREINKKIAEAIAEKLDLKPSQDVWDYKRIPESMLKGVDAIIFDVAAGTGNTLKKALLKIGAHARIVYAYVLINRMKELDASFFGEIKQVGKVESSVKFLMDFELPKYDNENLCPICKKIKELSETRKTTGVKAIREHIDEEIKRLQPQKTTFSEIDKLTPASKEFSKEERIEKIAIRIELENSRRYENVEIRYETINKYLKSFSVNPDNVFDLFEIISEEEYCFKGDFKDSAGVFYPDLKERIVETCLKIAKDEINYDERGLKYALSVLNIFSPMDFLNNLIPIFKKVAGGRL
ncbi:MAG: hypothetical protein QME42_07390 [bacterium]|nr:hypothetical protein [bacterium]